MSPDAPALATRARAASRKENEIRFFIPHREVGSREILPPEGRPQERERT
jgi:hypothetical protein